MNIEPYDLNLIFPVSFLVGVMIQEGIQIRSHTITVPSDDEEGWVELKLWYESAPHPPHEMLSAEFDWDFIYPVNVLLDDGTTTTVNNKTEMETLRENLL